METIEIREDDLRAAGVRVTDYVRQVVTCGDEPGTLSGGSLKGKAARYRGKYTQTINKVIGAVHAAAGVRDGMAKTSSNRLARVWVGPTGDPVRLTLS